MNKEYKNLKDITLDKIIKEMIDVFNTFDDPRKGKNKSYTMADAGLGAFSVFFMQSPSFLDHQKTLEQRIGNSNARTVFGVHEIPSDNQSRNLLDSNDPSKLKPLYSYLYNIFETIGIIESHRSFKGHLLFAFDGTGYFSSDKIHCENCTVKKHKDGRTSYSHSILTPVIVNPNCDKVIPLIPEFITPQDGNEKQDCEINAAKRWLKQHGEDYRGKKITMLGDDLYSHEPFCRDILAQGFDFILVCKQSSHAATYEYIDNLENSNSICTVKKLKCNGAQIETSTYRYANSVPIRSKNDSLLINWIEVTTENQFGKILYKNSFATSHTINDENVCEIVEAGRCRWKIENENNNTLKTKGYNFEHNYGHGKKHLSSILTSLIILAFTIHTLFEFINTKYQELREKLSSRKRFFNDARALTSYICFQSWEHLIEFMLNSFKYDVAYQKT